MGTKDKLGHPAEAAWRQQALISVEDMYAADRAAMAAGTPGRELMAAAGNAVVVAIKRRWQPCPTLVLCGPGNNGGDGFVVAAVLKAAGWPVRLALLGDRGALRGDAAWAADGWDGPIETISPDRVGEAVLVVDAIFGAGLGRPVDGVVAETVDAASTAKHRVAVDIPSGIHGDRGAVWGHAFKADLTVTFFRRKPGHLLLPGREHCGETVVADIGISDQVLDDIRPQTAWNHPRLWADALPIPTLLSHKYTRGQVLVRAGDMPGAAVLAAVAAARAGAGMVSVACPEGAEARFAGLPAAVVLRAEAAVADFAARVADHRVAAVVVGPGNGVSDDTLAAARAAVASGKPAVLDADALTAPGVADLLRNGAATRCVLTPHAGEFARLFGAVGRDPLAAVRQAAAETGAVVVLKGSATVIAVPDGRAVINSNAPPWLATAGAGDVLAGTIGALLAQGMAPFPAALAGTWVHGAAATAVGPGLIADDLPREIGATLGRFWPRD